MHAFVGSVSTGVGIMVFSVVVGVVMWVVLVERACEASVWWGACGSISIEAAVLGSQNSKQVREKLVESLT